MRPSIERWRVPLALALALLPALAAAQSGQGMPDPYPYPEPAWSPYVAGALIGLLVILSLIVANKPVGASSAYADTAGLAGRLVAPRHIASLKHFQDNAPVLGWNIVFILGTVAGGFLAAWSGGELTGTYLQDLWVARFGSDSEGLRTAVAFAGGVLIALGARIAGGCTSGHGISGTLQLSVGSWVAVICFFIGGIVAAMPLYRG